jgi:hypothetical protein
VWVLLAFNDRNIIPREKDGVKLGKGFSGGAKKPRQSNCLGSICTSVNQNFLVCMLLTAYSFSLRQMQKRGVLWQNCNNPTLFCIWMDE